MRKFIPFLILPLLMSCGGEKVAEKTDWPTYCIREVIFLDGENNPQGRVLLDMPGYPYGQTDRMIEISRWNYDVIDWDACKSDDPRMDLKPSGIDWADGRVTDIDGNPL